MHRILDPKEIAIKSTRSLGVSLLVFLALAFAGASSATEAAGKDLSKKNVVLLHGLARSHKSMDKLREALRKNGFAACNIGYPSTTRPIEELAMNFVLPAIKDRVGTLETPVDFVTHSMGGIIVRYIASHAPEVRIGRVVMLSPPNRGSEVVDVFGDMWLFGLINGPAGRQLGTGDESMPNSLGPADFELGVITGNKSINLILSAIVRGDDDGKVSVENAKLEGMKDFLVVPATHTFIMKNDIAIKQTLHFLEQGGFRRETEK